MIDGRRQKKQMVRYGVLLHWCLTVRSHFAYGECAVSVNLLSIIEHAKEHAYTVSWPGCYACYGSCYEKGIFRKRRNEDIITYAWGLEIYDVPCAFVEFFFFDCCFLWCCAVRGGGG